MAKMYNKNWNRSDPESDDKKIIDTPTLQDILDKYNIDQPDSIGEVLNKSEATSSDRIQGVLHKLGVKLEKKYVELDIAESNDALDIDDIDDIETGDNFTDTNTTNDAMYMDNGLCIIPGGGSIPYFHFVKWSPPGSSLIQLDQLGGNIMIDRPLYFSDEGFRGKLNEGEMNELVRFLKSKYSGDEDISTWKHLIKLWNINNPLRVLDNNIQIPEYYYDMPEY